LMVELDSFTRLYVEIKTVVTHVHFTLMTLQESQYLH
jgi:hypothetical protein